MTYIAEQNEHKDIYCYDMHGEYTGTLLNDFVAIGTGLPAQSTLIKVIAPKEGFTRIFNEQKEKWEYVEDHRGEKYFSTNDGSEIEIKEFGSLPPTITTIPRPDIWHVYIDGKWVMTAENEVEKAEYEKQQKISALNAELNQLKQDMIFAQMMGDDISEMKDRVLEIRAELEKL